MAYSAQYETRNGKLKVKVVPSTELRKFLLGVRRSGSKVTSLQPVR